MLVVRNYLRKSRLAAAAASLAAVFILQASPALAQSARTDFPSRPLKVIVGIQAGTGSDLAARFFCSQLAEVLAQPCTVENRPGANSLLGAMAVKQAPADGYTIFLGSNSPMAVNVALLKDMQYDPVKDFKPVYGLTLHTNVIVVPNSSPVRNMAELVAESKKRQLNVGTYASLYEMATRWIASATGSRFLEVPYKGLAQLTVDMMGSQLDFAVVDLAGAAPLLHAGKLRAIAVLGDRPHPDFPNVPPVKDSGYPEIVNYSWTALYVRSEVPDEALAKLVDAMDGIMKRPAAKAFVAKMNLELMPLSPVPMRRFQVTEIERFRKIATMAGMVPQ
jgi:tripartite-type tricarboxylate transporter receptor subunit TctC